MSLFLLDSFESHFVPSEVLPFDGFMAVNFAFGEMMAGIISRPGSKYLRRTLRPPRQMGYTREASMQKQSLFFRVY